MDWPHVGELLAASRDIYAELKNVCVRVKHNAGMGSLYRSQHELVFVFKHGRGSHRNNVQLGQYGRHRSNVWAYLAGRELIRTRDRGRQHPGASSNREAGRDGRRRHLDCSARGDVVLDSFLGSGTTVLTAGGQRLLRAAHPCLAPRLQRRVNGHLARTSETFEWADRKTNSGIC